MLTRAKCRPACYGWCMPQKTYRSELVVRWHELDSFGHLNHATYLLYLDHARWKSLESEGITLEQLKKWKSWPVVHSIEVQYMKPVFADQKLEIESRITECTRTSFFFEQIIQRDETPVAKARVRVAIVDDNGRPTAMQPELARVCPAAEAK